MSKAGTTENLQATAVVPPSREAVRARLSVTLLFVVMGTTIGSWASRVPDVRRAVGLGDAGWGLANTATTIGELLSLIIVAVLIGRVSTRRLALVGAALVLVNAPLLASAGTVVALVAGLFVWGFAANLLATPMNTQSVEVQHMYGRPILSTFHAGFSIGMFAGGILGTGAAAAGLTPGMQMAVSSGVLGAALIYARRWLPDTAKAQAADGTPRRGMRDRFTPQLLLLAFIAFLTSIVEMAAAQWSALYTSEALGAGAVAGAATYTSLSVAATVARLTGDRVAARLGRLRFVQLSVAVAAAGLTLALVVATPVAAMVGFGLLGLGMACVTPTIMGIAGEQPGLSTGEGVSVVTMGQWPGFLIAPPIIGALAGVVGLRQALAVLVVAAVCVIPLTRMVNIQREATA